MPWCRRHCLIVAGAFVAALSASSVSYAQTLSWDPNGPAAGTGGNGTWDTTTALWFDGTAFVPWTNGMFDGIFTGTAGIVTIGVPITAQNLTFGVSGYSVTGNTLTLGAGSTPTITVAPGISATSGATLTGSNGLIVTGGGTLTLVGAATYSGGTVIDGATLVVDGVQNGNRLAANSLVTVNTGGTFRILGVNALPSGANAVDVTVNAGGTLDVVSGSSPLSIQPSHASIRHLTLRDGSVVLNYSGAGTAFSNESFVLQGNVTATGTSSITLGALANTVNTGIAFSGSHAITVVNPADTLTVDANFENGTLVGTLVKDGAGTLNLLGANVYTGGTVVNAGTLVVDGAEDKNRLAANSLVTVNSSGTFRILGVNALPNNASAVNITVNAGGTLNVVSGNSAASNLPSHAHVRNLTLNSGTVTLDYSGSGTAFANQTLVLRGDVLSTGTSSIAFGPLATNSNAGVGLNGARTFSVVNAADALNVAAQLENGDAGIGTLIKTGAGTLVLTGINTYTGGTNVNAGALLINGNQTAGMVSVANGATLGGAGAIGGAVTITNGGTLAPGHSPGTLTLGALTLGAGAILDYELDTPGIIGGGVNDLIVINTDLTLDGTLNVTPLAGFGIGAYRLMNYGGSLFDNTLVFGSLPAGFAYALDTAVAGQINLNVSSLAPPGVQYWDGANLTGDGTVDGGSGTWIGGSSNWTIASGAANQDWGSHTAVFAGTSGTVSVTGPIAFDSIRFLTSGYTITAGASGMLTADTPGTVMLLGPGVGVATIDASIQGSGSLDIQGGGTLVLGGDNRYTGGTNIASGATLQLGNGGTSGSATGNVANDGTLAFNRSDTVTFAGTIAGSGVVRQDGSGTLVLSGTNTYSGGTIINAGVIAISADANLGAGSGTVTIGGGSLRTTADIVSARAIILAANTGEIATDTGTTLRLSGAVDGPGALVKTGGGTLVLSGVNTYAGGTVIYGGTLSISADVNLGAANQPITIDGGTLQLTATLSTSRPTTLGAGGGIIQTDAGTMFTLSSSIGGPGGLSKTGAGTLTLTGANTYAGGTRLSGGTLSISSDANLGAASSAIVIDHGTLQTTADMSSSRSVFINGAAAIDTANNSTFLFQGVAGGNGSLTKAGSGVLVLSGANDYGGGTTIGGGALQIGNCGTSGSIAGDVRNDSILAFSRSDTHVFGGAISGSGVVVKHCTGTTVLTGTNAYSGGTLVEAGVLQGDTRSLQGDILVDNASLVFDQSFDGAFAGTLFGTGTFIKRGTGTLWLTGSNGLQGVTAIEAGAMGLNGTMQGGVAVGGGATFEGSGIVGGSLIVDGTINVRRGHSAFGLGVLGDVTLNAGSKFGVDVDAEGVNSGLVANGIVAINGSTVEIAADAATYGRVTHYAILRGLGGITGSAAASASSSVLDPYLSKDETTLFLTLLRTDLPLQDFAVTGNGRRVAGALDRVKASATGDRAYVTRELTALDDATLGRSLDAIAGEIHASAVVLAAMDGDSITEGVRSEIAARVSSDQRAEGIERRSLWSAGGRRGWFHLQDERATFDPRDADNGPAGGPIAHGGRAAIDGFVLAMDWTMAGNWLAGVGGSYSTGTLTLDGLNESADYDAPRVLGYIGYAWSRVALSGGVTAARTSYDRNRRFHFTAMGPAGRPLFEGVDREAISTPHGIAAEFWGEARLAVPFGVWDLQPAAGIRRARYGLGAWSEDGAGALALSAAAQPIYSLQADAGLRLSRTSGRVRPYLGGGLRRELGSAHTTVAVQLANEPDGFFQVDGLTLPQDAVIGEAGLLFQAGRFGLSVGYVGRQWSDNSRHTVRLAIGM